MQILVPDPPTEPTPPGAVPVIMPPNNYDPATATTPPDYGGDYAPSAFRTPDGGVYMVMPTQIHYIVRPSGLTTYWSSEAGDYVLPAPPNWNCWSWGTKYADGHLSWGMSPVLQFGTGIDAPTGWAMCSTPPDGYSWPSDMPDGVRGDHSWELFAEGMTTVDWPLLQAMSTEPILESRVSCDKTFFDIWYTVNFAVFARISTVTDRGRKAAAGIVPIISTLFGLAVLLGSGSDNSTGRRYVKKRLY